jgi:hypothetical protein
MLHMLLFTTDPLLVTSFKNVSRELGIEAEFSQDCQQVSHQLNHAKYEAVVVDFDTVSNARPVLASVRKSRSRSKRCAFRGRDEFCRCPASFGRPRTLSSTATNRGQRDQANFGCCI